MMKNWVEFLISLGFRTCSLVMVAMSVEAALGLSLSMPLWLQLDTTAAFLLQ